MIPRITLAVLAYNQSRVISEAVESALAQACEPIEILLSDDASPDATFATMQACVEAYGGPHEVVLRRNPRNLGIGEHVNAVMRDVRGQLVVFMAGDDISLPTRVARTAEAWDRSGNCLDLIACNLIDMSQDGIDLGVIELDDLSQWKSPDDWAQRRPRVIGAGHAITRRLYERFGPLPPRAGHEEEIHTLRALFGGGAVTLREPLVRYRRGGVSQKMSDFSGAQYLAWIRRQNIDQLAQHAQWLADAEVAGSYALMKAAIRREHDREIFIRDLLGAGHGLDRWRVTVAASSVDLGWRLRKFLYFQWPELAGSMRRLQAQVRRIRHGEQR